MAGYLNYYEYGNSVNYSKKIFIGFLTIIIIFGTSLTKKLKIV